ncbi:MAG: hypothetical protein KatS3mg057_1927 [Herpetosiphonaceae bacterium]|nr:MAG: hypothetical protein KatS3mg057_1927 [Herpetosiphonaceae bacterium]
MSIVLIHSPLVGPATWTLVAEELERRGQHVVVPSLLEALQSEAALSQAIAQRVFEVLKGSRAVDPLVLVAHSAAGSFIPVIREALPYHVTAYVFVDARLPEKHTSLFDTTPPDLTDYLRSTAQGGWLPPWAEWFGEHALREVIPDDEVRQQFLSEQRPIPLRLFEEPIPVFSGWPDAPCGYIRFGTAYERESQQAAMAGWPTIQLGGEHMHMLVEPQAVTDALLNLLALLSSGANSRR